MPAQTAQIPRETAIQFLRENPAKFGLSAADVADVRITDDYGSKHNGVHHVWLQQQYLGIPVYNALAGLHVLPSGEVLHPPHRFAAGLAAKVNTVIPSLSAAKALDLAMANLGFTGFPGPGVRKKINERNWIFEGGAVSRADIPVSACYNIQKDGFARLAWSMLIDQANTSDVWSMRVDAQTGLILGKSNLTVYCKHGNTSAMPEDCVDVRIERGTVTPSASNIFNVNESYNVFPLPVESPSHGGRQLLVNPADPIASPYGWLDVNGVPGADFTYTRGNNAWAYDDSADDNTPSVAESADGGPGLVFNFPFDPNAEPAGNRDAAITNLFYMSNAMHDFAYRFGFDEVSGNFQENNYGHGNPAFGGDGVLAEAMDGSGANNSNFYTPKDSIPGRMQMYKWDRPAGNNITVTAPGSIAGPYFGGTTNGWGAPITTTPVSGLVVFADDGSSQPNLGCEPLINNVAGKIVMVDRGGDCQFSVKALNAQQAGAIACVICDHEAPPITGNTIGPGQVGNQVTIPVAWMKKADCNILRQFAGNGLQISLVLPTDLSGPNQLDGDFDNGIIAHEYAHGISNRLTGGPSEVECLLNGEQMGEGWSDFFALVTTVEPGDASSDKQGIGSYVFRQPTDGAGVRRYAYSTDMGINPLTYGNVADSPEEHARGEVWTAMVWDLYWAFVEKYGYDADLNNTNSGNFRAIQLVMDGLKLQPCSPGTIDGRDAILLADKMNYAGADTCLISSVFARRGLGVAASQGSEDVPIDGKENFDPIPACVKSLKINKITTTPLVDPEGFADYVLTVTNHKDAAVSNVNVTDELPAGLSFISASNGGIFSNGMVVWNLGAVQSGQVITLTYRAQVNAGIGSQCLYRNPMDDEDFWSSYPINTTNPDYFYLQNDEVKVGTSAFQAPEAELVATNFVLETSDSLLVSGNRPVFRFWHKYNTEVYADAGFIEIQKGGETAWLRLPADKMFRNPYPYKVQFATFNISNNSGFSGNSNGWVQSYLDLSAYAGNKVNLRFHFGTDNNTAPFNGAWYVDEVQMMDMVNFEGAACVTSAEGDQACSEMSEGGVIVNTSCLPVATEEPAIPGVQMQVQPNPADDLVYVTLDRDLNGHVQFSLLSTDGRVAFRQSAQSHFAGQVFMLDVQQMAAGIYLLRMESDQGVRVTRVVIQ